MTEPRTSPNSEVSKREFGYPTAPVQSVVTLSTTAPARLLQNNPGRVSYLITNRGTDNVSVGFNPSIIAGGGFLLAASGGAFSMDVKEDGETVGYEIWAIADSGTPDVIVTEVHAI